MIDHPHIIFVQVTYHILGYFGGRMDFHRLVDAQHRVHGAGNESEIVCDEDDCEPTAQIG